MVLLWCVMIEITNQEVIWLAEIESTLILSYFPFFFAMDKVYDGNVKTVNIMLCCKTFRQKGVNDRISEVYKLINETNPDILKNMNVIVETYDWKEFEEMIDNNFL